MIRSILRRVLIVLGIVLVLIQFIRPTKNQSNEIVTNDDISRVYTIPDEVHNMLIKKCYDCHSNHTNYPWYFNFQPVAWWLADHIREGKSELNFSEFSNYPPARANHKLEELGEVMENGSMPLQSYTWLHPHSTVTEEEKQALYAWLESMNINFRKEQP